MEKLSSPFSPENFADYLDANPDIKEAHDFAKEALAGQMRRDGSTSFSHSFGVAKRIYDLGIRDNNMIKAGFLHDITEDTEVTSKDIEDKFGKDVAFLVEGVSEFRTDIQISKADKDKETLKKSFKFAHIDPRVALLKAAGDRHENMESLWVMDRDKQIKKALETFSYTTLLESLGVWIEMKTLQDMSLQYSAPDEFKNLSEILAKDFRTDERFTGFWKSRLEKTLQDSNFDAEVEVKITNLFRLKHKMELNDIRDINDLVSFVINVKKPKLVDNPKDAEKIARNNCYDIMGLIRQEFGYLEDIKRFDDFFSFPQPNGYSAIQLTMNSEYGCFEIDITSEEKNEFNNWGVVSLMRSGVKDLSSYSRVLVFTESDEVKFFPSGATGVDFAYSISELMGAQATGIEINGKVFPITQVLPNGAQLKVLLGKNRLAPEIDYKGMCLPITQKIIDKQIVNLSRQETIERGREVITKIIEERGLLDLSDLLQMNEHAEKLVNFLYHTGCKRSLGNLYYKAGAGRVSEKYWADQLETAQITRDVLKLNTISIEGEDVSGILEFMGAKIKEFEGNVGPMSSRPEVKDEKRYFKARLIIENLNQEKLEELQTSLLNNPAIKKVTIV